MNLGGNSQKLHLTKTLNKFVSERVDSLIFSDSGKFLPCRVVAIAENGAMVTVAFDIQEQLPQATIPVMCSQYHRPAIHIGDEGVTISASVSLGKASGQNEATPSLMDPQLNLSCLMFVPVGSAKWAENLNHNYETILARISDGTYSTTPTQMSNAWDAFVAVYNNHTHGGGPKPDQQYTGSSIATHG